MEKNSWPFVLDSQEAPWAFLCPVSSSRAIGVHSLSRTWGSRDQSQVLIFVWRALYSLRNLPRSNILLLFFLVFKGRVYMRIESTLLDLCSHFNMMLLLGENLFNLFTLCNFSASEVLRHCCSAKATEWLSIRIPCSLLARSDWIKMCRADSFFLTITLPYGIWEQWSGLSASPQAEKHLQWNTPMG